LRIVLDTNILARANSRAGGAAVALLELIRDSGVHTLILSPFLLTELERVLNYPRLQTMWPLTQGEIAGYIQALQDFGELVLPGLPQAVVTFDPADDFVLATAVVGRADALCTLDRHIASPAVREHARLHGVEIMNDVELLRRLRLSNVGLQ
jgi:putative PIN family toxin of toxin-antitoxin system